MQTRIQDYYLGEILLSAFDVVPDGFAPCDGRLLPIERNEALFSLLSTTFGGNGVTTFALPDLRGRVPVGVGAGPGLPLYTLGEKGGAPSVTLLAGNVPPHTHNVAASSAAAMDTIPEGNYYAASPAHYQAMPNAYMNFLVTSIAGNSQPHTNMMPSLALNWLIVIDGIYPPRQQFTSPAGDK